MNNNRAVDEWLLEDSDLDGNTTYGHLGDDVVDKQKRHVELNEVEGVTFLGGNQFINEVTFDEMSGTQDENDLSTICDCNGGRSVMNACRGVGIYAWKSSFVTVRGGPCYFPKDPATHAYDPEDGCFKCTGTRNLFSGMSFGIFVNDRKDKKSTAFLTGNTFENCAIGIRAEESENIFINRNEFKLDGRGSIYYDHFAYHVGVWLINSGNWDIADNLFDYDAESKVDVNGTPSDQSDDLYYDPSFCVTGYLSAGIVIDNGGQSRGRSYKNVYDFLKIAGSTRCGNPFIAELYNGSNEVVHIQCNDYDVESTGDSEDLRIANYQSYSAFKRNPNNGSYMGLHLPYSTQINDKSDILPHLSSNVSNQFMTHNDWYPPTTIANGNSWSGSYGTTDYHISFRDWNVSQYNTATPELFYNTGDQPTKILDNSGNPGSNDPWLQILPGGPSNSCNSSSYCKFFETESSSPAHIKEIYDNDILDPKFWTKGGTGEGWVGVEEYPTQIESRSIEVWPTNVYQKLYFNLENVQSETVNLQIINMQGKTVMIEDINYKNNIDLSKLNSGFYLIYVTTTKGSAYHAYFNKM